MDKTIHKKLTEKFHYYRGSAAVACADEDLLGNLGQELNILNCAAKELLQPRPQAIAAILEKARSL